jgi:hypothetical protein
MIARCQILLPFSIWIEANESFPNLKLAIASWSATVHPLAQAAVGYKDFEVSRLSASWEESVKLITPAVPPIVNERVLSRGSPIVEKNLLIVDFLKTHFERGKSEIPQGPADPSTDDVFSVINEVLRRLRQVTRSPRIKLLKPDNTIWTLTYLGDDGEELPEDPRLTRRLVKVFGKFDADFVFPETWLKLLEADVVSYVWQDLLLDSFAALPEINQAIVLAYSALETFAEWSVDQLSRVYGLSPTLWKWVAERNGRHELQPSVSDQFDALLKIFGGKSLKEGAPELWEAFGQLRTARNKIAHEGRPIIVGKTVTLGQATDLVLKAERIIDWIEALLPASLHRPPRPNPLDLSMAMPLVPPNAEVEQKISAISQIFKGDS